MFRDFSFDAPMGRSSGVFEDTRTDISPTATPPPSESQHSGLPSPRPRPRPRVTSISELQQRLNQHHLQHEMITFRSPFDLSTCPPTTIPTDTDADRNQSDPSSPKSNSVTFSQSRRLQRQLHMRLQCGSGYSDKITSLVQEMIARGDQCQVCDSPPSSAESLSPGSTEDEAEEDGGDSGIEDCDERRASSPGPRPGFSYRRSGDIQPGHACVRKSVRQRKRHVVKRRAR